jgi:hypothetical protein
MAELRRAEESFAAVSELEAGRRAWRELGLLAQHNAPAVLLERGDPLAPLVWEIAREIAVRHGLVGRRLGATEIGSVVDAMNELYAALDELGVPRELARERERRLRDRLRPPG